MIEINMEELDFWIDLSGKEFEQKKEINQQIVACVMGWA